MRDGPAPYVKGECVMGELERRLDDAYWAARDAYVLADTVDDRAARFWSDVSDRIEEAQASLHADPSAVCPNCGDRAGVGPERGGQRVCLRCAVSFGCDDCGLTTADVGGGCRCAYGA